MNTIEIIYETICKMFRSQFDIEDIDRNKNYFDGDIATSLDALKFLVKVEKEFNIVINDRDLGPEIIQTLWCLSEYIENVINGSK